MLSKVNSMALQGLDGYLVDVQVDVSNNMPSWEKVGLPDTSVREAKERVKTAIKNSGYELLSKKNSNKFGTSRYEKRRVNIRPSNCYWNLSRFGRNS